MEFSSVQFFIYTLGQKYAKTQLQNQISGTLVHFENVFSKINN